MALDVTKLNEIATRLAGHGENVAERNGSADREFWRQMGVAFGDISEAIRELAAAAEVEHGDCGGRA